MAAFLAFTFGSIPITFQPLVCIDPKNDPVPQPISRRVLFFGFNSSIV